jgi:tetratricopeptide (TPR) repeat protein
VPFQQRQGSAISRSQMRAMVRLADIYKSAGMEKEYLGSMVTAVEIFAGDKQVTFDLLNYLIDGINRSRANVMALGSQLRSRGVDPASVPLEGALQDSTAAAYQSAKLQLDSQETECYRIMSNACWQIPYNADLYYRTASLQFIRAQDDGDQSKYKDAINFLKRAIASDSGHLESYDLIALAYEKLGDKNRAIRFWQLFETVYEIAPQVIGPGFITPERQRLHAEAVAHLAQLGAKPEEG